MPVSQETKLKELKQSLLESIGENDAYPTTEELAAHKQRAKHKEKYQDLTFTSMQSNNQPNEKE
jgi:hypothetical protein